MDNQTSQKDPFVLSSPYKDPVRRALFWLLKTPLERLFRFPEMSKGYKEIQAIEGDFVDKVIDHMNLDWDVNAALLDRIPRNGPLIVLANHPFGAADGLIMLKLLRSIRSDVKTLNNFVLQRVPELHEHMIFVDPFGRDKSKQTNITPMKHCIAWLRQGGVLGIFPSGVVSHLHLRERAVVDPLWQPHVARIIRKAKAPVLPLYFHGRNNWLFQLAGLIHPRLRTLLLPRTMLKCRDRTITVRVGHPISSAKLQAYDDDEEMLRYLRMRTYILNPGNSRKQSAPTKAPPRSRNEGEPIVPPVEPEKLAEEVGRLSADQLLIESGDYQVWAAKASEIPSVVREIGRLREITFRGTGEGTGKAIDLDRFDKHYWHLFVWRPESHEVVGAYRMGKTDKILARLGKNGLYTSTLYKFSSSLFKRISPALELGRSFVRPEYQRTHSPLALLWRGVGEYVVRHPRYKILFGSVSISSEYQSLSQQMMVQFLQQNSDLPDLARMVKPRNPPACLQNPDLPEGCRLITDIKDVSSVISDIESDRKGVPILLRQYLQFNANFISFHEDPEFNNTITALMLVDFSESHPRVLERHLGKEGSRQFLAYHGKLPAEEAAAAS
jgi:putative hemolysin